MKHLALCILSCLVVAAASAQRIRFSETTNHWKMILVDLDETGISEASYGPDTLIAGSTYKLLLDQNATLGIREDSNSGRIYYRLIDYKLSLWGALADTTEHLYFDYNVRTGDTVRWNIATATFAFIVHQYDSVRLGIDHYKHWRLTLVSTPPGWNIKDFDFIEGIGSSYGPAYNVCPKGFEQGSQLRCFTTKGANPQCNPAVPLPSWGVNPRLGRPILARFFDNDTSCNIRKVAVARLPSPHAPFMLPNPVLASTVLEVPAAARMSTLSIYNATGAIVLQKTLLDGDKIAVGQSLPHGGWYCYIVQDAQTGERRTGSLIRM